MLWLSFNISLRNATCCYLRGEKGIAGSLQHAASGAVEVLPDNGDKDCGYHIK